MGKMKEFVLQESEEFSQNSSSVSSWRKGVMETLQVLPVETLKTVAQTSELGYFARIILKDKGVQI